MGSSSSLFPKKRERHEMGRYLSLVLRQLAPDLDLCLDGFGWVDIQKLVSHMATRVPSLSLAHILEIVDRDPQKRFEILGTKIRAKAGHRYPMQLGTEPVRPPAVLYHGTSKTAAQLIFSKGLLRMGKAYVHLASTKERARRVGLRKSQSPIILSIRAGEAHDAEIKFWRSGQVSPDGEIYLSEEIPAEFIFVEAEGS